MGNLRRRSTLNELQVRPEIKSILGDFGNQPMPPQCIEALSGGAGILNVDWTPALSNNVVYHIFVDNVEIGTSNTTNYSITGLNANQPYKIEVTTYDNTTSTMSEKSVAIIRESTSSDDTTNSPPSFQAIQLMWGAVQLNWDDPTNVPAGGYKIYRVGSDIPFDVLNLPTNNNPNPTQLSAPTNSASVKLTGLTPGRSYLLYLVAIDSNGTEVGRAPNQLYLKAYSRALLNDYTPPSVPTNVHATAGNSSIHVTWNAATDSQSGVFGYSVFVNGLLATQSATLSANVAGLTNNQSYSVSVLAYDHAGNPSPKSMAVNVTPNSSGSSYSASTVPATFTQDSSGNLTDPSGNPYIAIGCNVDGPFFVWAHTPTVGNVSAAVNNWHWNIIRVPVSNADWKNGAYIFTQNNNLDGIVQTYTAQNVVVKLCGRYGTGSILSSAAGTIPDPSGRSEEQAIGDFWVEMAKKYNSNPYVWFNLYNEPSRSAPQPDADAATTSNVTPLSGLQTIDSVSLTDGQIALLLGQTNAVENGPWVVSAGSWTRPATYPSGSDATTFVQHVSSGGNHSVNGTTNWAVSSSTGALIVDTSNVSFTQVDFGYALNALNNRLIARIRTIAPYNPIVLDAANYGQDIPSPSAAGDGNIVTSESFHLTYTAGLSAAWGQAAGYGPIIASVHMYNRWASGASGSLSYTQIAPRIRDYVTRIKALGLTLIIGEMGLSNDGGAYGANIAVCKAALYLGGTLNSQTTGVLQEQSIGIMPWHGDADSPAGMNVAASGNGGWANVTNVGQANPSPATGVALWNYGNTIN